VNSAGKIYAVDSAARAIAIFDQDGRSFIWATNDALFKNVTGLAIDDRDWLFVTDSDLRRVTVINAAGQPQVYFGANHLVRPAGAAIDNRNLLLYVADPGQDKIAVFETLTYSFVRFIGAASNENSAATGVLSKPTNVAVDSDGIVYVSDTLNGRIQVFDSKGNFQRVISKLGFGPGSLFRPKGIAIDCNGHIWVADAGQNRIQVFDKEGHLLAYFGQKGDFPGQFVLAAGLFIDSNNRVMVSDSGSGRVQVFRYITDSEAAAMKNRRQETDPSRLRSSNSH
jgi:DNA-binding beta-propeller fold protein YncE